MCVFCEGRKAWGRFFYGEGVTCSTHVLSEGSHVLRANGKPSRLQGHPLGFKQNARFGMPRELHDECGDLLDKILRRRRRRRRRKQFHEWISDTPLEGRRISRSLDVCGP